MVLVFELLNKITGKVKALLKFLQRSVCNSQQSFAKRFDFAHSRGGDDDHEVGESETISEESQEEMIDFLFEVRNSTQYFKKRNTFSAKFRDWIYIFKIH